MDGCRAKRSTLMLYVDRELDPDRALEFERHLEECDACARFVERSVSMEELLESTLAPAVDARKAGDFLQSVRERLPREEAAERGLGSPATRPEQSLGGSDLSLRTHSLARRRALLVLAAAAAAVLLLWVFSFLDEKSGEIDVPADEDSLAADLQSTESLESSAATAAETGNAMLEAERKRVHADFGALLAGLAGSPEDELYSRYRQAVVPLDRQGWRTDVLLSGALKRERGEALQTAVRLARSLPATESLPDLVPSLGRLLAKGVFTFDVMESLAVQGGPRAVAALGKTLGRPELRDRGLVLLAGMKGAGPVREIAGAASDDLKRTHPLSSDFTTAAVRSLARMGSDGLNGILTIYAQSGFSPAIIRVLAATPEPARLLAERLADTRNIVREPDLRLAVALRLEEAVPLLIASADDPSFRKDYTTLIAMVGGPKAVGALFELYTGPASLRERRVFCASLAEVFDFFPEETGPALADALGLIDKENRDVLVSMLGEAGTAGACRALGWLVENSPELESAAALNLARVGSNDALAVLLNLLEGARLSGGARLAAAAAAFHLGGDAILERILTMDGQVPGRAPAPFHGTADRRRALRRGVLTDTRFEKIQAIIAQYTNS